MKAFNYIFFAVVLLVVFIRIWQTFFRKNGSIGIKKEGWTFPAAVIIYNLIIIGTILEYIFIDKEVNYKISVLGLLLGGIGLSLTVLAIKNLGQWWSLSIEIKKNHEIIKKGVYSYVRHPYYMGVLFEITGFILFANSYYTLVFILLLFPIIIYRMRLEESVMISVFGEEYEKYKREIGAFFPLIMRSKCEQKKLNGLNS